MKKETSICTLKLENNRSEKRNNFLYHYNIIYGIIRLQLNNQNFITI